MSIETVYLRHGHGVNGTVVSSNKPEAVKIRTKIIIIISELITAFGGISGCRDKL